jgi:hypothetical protein
MWRETEIQMFIERLEDRRLYSTTVAHLPTTVLAPPPTPTPTATSTGPAAPISGGALAPDLDPNLNYRNSIRRVGDTLYVIGSFDPDTITISQNGNYVQVIFGNGVMQGTYLVARPKNIILAGDENGDFLNVDSHLNIPAEILGGAGDDILFGGASSNYMDGGAGNDTIRGGPSADTIFGGDGNDNIIANGGDDIIHGGAGNDTIDAGAGADTVFADDGNDTVFGGLGNDHLHGGNGDDTLVSVFGGTDIVDGDGGWDIFMADKNDSLADADSLATQRGSVYKISKFANPTSGNTYATELGTVPIADPALTFRATAYADFTGTPLFTPAGPAMGDVQQNQLNDCWLSSTAASVARSTPWAIKRTVIPLGDGTFAVALGNQVYREDADLPVDAKGNPIYGSVTGRNGKSLWFGLLEKAMAYHMKSGNSYTYDDVESDVPGTAFDALRVNYDRSELAFFSMDEGDLWDAIVANNGKPMVVTTEPGWLGVNDALQSSHAYSIVGYFKQGNGQKMVILRNPDDMNGRDGHSTGQTGQLTISVSELYDSCLLFYVGT